MQNSNISLKHALTAVSKTILILALFTAVLLFTRIPAYADNPALTVQLNGETKKEFSTEELQQIADAEGNRSYSFSAWNTYPTFELQYDIYGPTVDAVLDAAGVRDSVKDKGTVVFSATDGYEIALTGRQLFGTARYYFPDGNLVNHVKGLIPPESYANSEAVPAVISLDEGTKHTLFVGQEAPNEENNPLFVHNLSSGGIINVSTADAPQCTPPRTDPASGSLCRPGDTISITSDNDAVYDKILYTFGDETPGYGSPIFNCGPQGPARNRECRPVVPEGDGPFVLRVVVKGYGKQDSTLRKFSFIITALTVKVDGTAVKSYDLNDLDAIPDAGPYDYSGYNSFPTFSVKHVDAGKRVDDIIEDATGHAPESFGENSVVEFTAGDGYSSELTIGQLFNTDRYYFPNAPSGTDRKGGQALPAAYQGKVKVPAVIDTADKKALQFGQSAPNDQNYPECVSGMLINGVIEISTAEAGKCAPVGNVTPAGGSVIDEGTKIVFPELSRSDYRNKVYYAVDPADGKAPGSGCAFYHYSPYNWPAKLFNPPVMKVPGIHTLSVRVSAYGRQDSDVTEFRYTVRPAAVGGVRAAKASYNSVKVSWNRKSSISGYRIYRRAGSASESLLKTVGPDVTSFTDTKLATGTSYTYRVAAVVRGTDGKLIQGKMSSSAGAKPVLAKPAISLKAGRRKITVSWKKVAGANGYEVCRSTKKSSGYKIIKTVKKGSQISFTSKKLKKGKKYYFRIRAYRNVSGKKVYSSYSSVKYKKAK